MAPQIFKPIARTLSLGSSSISYVLVLVVLSCLSFSTLATLNTQLSKPYEVYEEEDPGTFVGNIARDSLIYTQFNQSEFQSLQYQIPSTNSKFTIDSRTSTIRTAQKLDREAECDTSVEIICMIKFDVSVYRLNADGSFLLLGIIKVEVIIKDRNDNDPEFPSKETTLDVPESLPLGEVLRTSGAIDRDAGMNTVQTYSLVGGGDMFGLQVIQNPGSPSSDLGIVLKKKLDREITSSYNLQVVAEDGGFPQRTGTVNILIRVIDVNDNEPRFESTLFNTTVKENVEVGTTILNLLASDPDDQENGRLTFSFSPSTQTKIKDYLAINASSGAIYLIKGLDYEDFNSFRFFATVSDNGSPAKSSQASVQIVVEDVNDNAPQLEITVPTTLVNESIRVGSYIAHISLSDKDSSQNSNFSCSVANQHFVLQRFPDPTSTYFTVILKEHLDYEKSKTEVLNVTCTDGGNPPLSNSSSAIIHVRDVNDNAPVFTRNTYLFSIDENNYPGEFIAQIKAVDPDEGINGNVSYSLNSTLDDKFSVNPTSGVIKAMQTLDRERKSSYVLYVIAKDKGYPPISSTATVSIRVIDVNDNPPQFAKPHFEMPVPENSREGTSIDTLLVRDPDVDADNHLRFRLAQNFSFPTLFRLDQMTGTVYTMGPLDRETKDVYTFDVIVYDETQPDYQDIAQVRVVVTDVNDNAPNITYPTAVNTTFVVTYNREPGKRILTVEAEDPDHRENGTFGIRFSLAEGNEKGLFFLNSITGELVIAQRMTAYDTGPYKLKVRARDGGLVYMETTRDITIEVTIANGTIGYLEEDDGAANMAIVIALVCITAVLAVAVLITICIIRRIDRERKHHNSAKVEEENIYKQRSVQETGDISPMRDNFENEIEKLKRKIKRDLSFTVEDDTDPLDCSGTTNKSTFSTFRNTPPSQVSDAKAQSSPGGQSSVLQNTLSPVENNVKRVHYMDKALDIDRLTTTAPPPRSQPFASSSSNSSSAYHSGRGHQWAPGRSHSARTSLVKLPVEDSASHSSGSTSDSGRGGSSEEGEGHGHTASTMVVAIGNDGDRPKNSTNSLPATNNQLVTFGSPRSTASSSGTSLMPRSLSSSLNSETARKRLWGDTSLSTPTGSIVSTATSGNGNSGVSTESSSTLVNAHIQPLHMAETSSDYKPNISFSDDSVTANATVGKSSSSQHLDDHGNENATNVPKIPERTFGRRGPQNNGQFTTPSNLNKGVAKSSDALNSNPSTKKTPETFASTARQRLGSYPNQSDTPYRLLTANLSQIPPVDSSTSRHGMFVDASSMVDPLDRSTRSRSYANSSRNNPNAYSGGKSSNSTNNNNNILENSQKVNHHRHPASRNPTTAAINGDNNSSIRNAFSQQNSLSLPERSRGRGRYANITPNVSQESTTSGGEPYSLADVVDVLEDEDASTMTHQDDDNTTTTSGSYTINADELCLEIDHLFFNDVVV